MIFQGIIDTVSLSLNSPIKISINFVQKINNNSLSTALKNSYGNKNFLLEP